MTAFLKIYMAIWSGACVTTLILFLRDKNAFAISHRGYWRFLFEGWKVTTFLIAAIGMTLVAPYTGDPTWDYFDAAFMSILTFMTAPWVVGVIYKALRGGARLKEVFVALCLWMFSASWSYDLYILLRDGFYPFAWVSNIFLSSVLYISAGLLWNLDWRERRGVIFAFMEPDWPTPSSQARLDKVFWFALPFMLLATSLILAFLFRWS